MKTLTLLLILALSVVAADKTTTPIVKPTDAQKAEYWQLMTRATAASLKVANIKEQARKAIEQAEAEAVKEQNEITAAYQKLDAKFKAGGCVLKQLPNDIDCETSEKK